MILAYTIGRSGADIVLNDPAQSISKLHAELTLSPDGRSAYLVDCGSSNGTFIQRHDTWEQIKQDIVNPTDRIRFGSMVIQAAELMSRVPRR